MLLSFKNVECLTRISVFDLDRIVLRSVALGYANSDFRLQNVYRRAWMSELEFCSYVVVNPTNLLFRTILGFL